MLPRVASRDDQSVQTKAAQVFSLFRCVHLFQNVCSLQLVKSKTNKTFSESRFRYMFLHLITFMLLISRNCKRVKPAVVNCNRIFT